MDARSGSIGEWAGGADSPLLKSKRRRATANSLDAVPIARAETRHTNTRESDRHPAHGKACTVTYRGAQHDAEVLNLSGGGAMLAIGLQPNLAERLDLHLGEEGTVECVIRWVKPGRIGLEFAHETHLDCPAEERAEVLHGVVERLFPTRRSEVLPAPAPPANPSDQRVAKRHPLIWSAELHA